MHTVEIPDRNITLKAPENIWECTRLQYQKLLENYLGVLRGEYDDNEFRTRLVYQFFNLKVTVNLMNKNLTGKKGEQRRAALINITRIGELFDSFFIPKELEGKTKLFLDTYCPIDKVKSFWYKGIVYYSGGDALSNLSFGEYIAGITAYDSITDFNDIESYIPLAAVIYAPAKHLPWLSREFPERQPFNQKNHIKRQRKLKGLPHWLLLNARYAWESHMRYISDGPITINGKDVDMRILFKGSDGDSQKSSGLGMNTVLFKLAESGVFGDYDKAEKRDLFTVLSMLYQQQWEAQEAKKKLKKK